jgi:hypothetical protein
MSTLSIPELAMLANQVLNNQRSVLDVSVSYSLSDYIDGLELSLTTLERLITGLSEAQFLFRIPGTPTGNDWNHDRHHFNAPELVTHLTGDLKGTVRTLIEEGAALPEPIEVLPLPVETTGEKGPGFGRGGRSDITLAQTIEELQTTQRGLVAALRAVPLKLWEQSYYSNDFGSIQVGHLVVVMALHSGAHVLQLLEIQAHDLYPTDAS